MKPFRFSHPIRVRYSEIDGQKIVFNAHYLTYLDVATIEYFRHVIGPHFLKLAEEGHFDVALVKVTIDFKQPARLDDVIDVHCRVARLGNSSMNFEYMITRDNDVLVEAETVHVNFDPQTGKSRPIPDDIRTKISDFEQLT
jgi:acyl-CoA thioester hydrolase